MCLRAPDWVVLGVHGQAINLGTFETKKAHPQQTHQYKNVGSLVLFAKRTMLLLCFRAASHMAWASNTFPTHVGVGHH